jgi:GT2 family glycosyltransferase
MNSASSLDEVVNWPLVTVIVVNFNSMKIKNIITESLRAIFNLKYRPLEIIVVDNGSNDGSFDYIKNLAMIVAPRDVKVRFLKLSKNYGFAVANNIAFAQRSKEAKYIALINNDLAPYPNSLTELVEFLERNSEVGGCQGKILTWDGRKIDSAGCLLTLYGNAYVIGQTLPSCACNVPMHISYTDGAYSVYRVEAILRCKGLFFPYFFIYGDDYELGIRLWRSGYKLLYVPIAAGRHYRSATSSESSMKPWIEYWAWRSEVSVMIMYDDLWLMRVLLRVPMTLLSALLTRRKSIIRGFIDGIYTGLKLRPHTRGFRVSQWREPRLKMSIFKWYAQLVKFFIRYGMRASRAHYVLISKMLGVKATSQGTLPTLRSGSALTIDDMPL